MGLTARRKDVNTAVLLPRKKEAVLPSSQGFPRSEGLAEAQAPVLPGEAVADGLYAAVLASRVRGEELLLSSPSVRAYESERRLVRALDQGLAEELLPSLLEDYQDSHRMPSEGEAWTGDEVDLFYVTVKKDGRTVTGYTANRLQVRILAELWKRRSQDAELDLIPL